MFWNGKPHFQPSPQAQLHFQMHCRAATAKRSAAQSSSGFSTRFWRLGALTEEPHGIKEDVLEGRLTRLRATRYFNSATPSTQHRGRKRSEPSLECHAIQRRKKGSDSRPVRTLPCSPMFEVGTGRVSWRGRSVAGPGCCYTSRREFPLQSAP